MTALVGNSCDSTQSSVGLSIVRTSDLAQLLFESIEFQPLAPMMTSPWTQPKRAEALSVLGEQEGRWGGYAEGMTPPVRRPESPVTSSGAFGFASRVSGACGTEASYLVLPGLEP